MKENQEKIHESKSRFLEKIDASASLELDGLRNRPESLKSAPKCGTPLPEIKRSTRACCEQRYANNGVT